MPRARKLRRPGAAAGTGRRAWRRRSGRSRRRCRARRTPACRPRPCVAPTSIGACSRRPVNFQAFSIRFCSASRTSCGSPVAVRPGAIVDGDVRASATGARSSATICAASVAEVDRARASSRARVTFESASRSSISCAHAAGRVPDPVEVAARLVVEHRAGVLDQRLAEAVDAAQRRAQVVRDRVAERLELAVGVVQRALDQLVAPDLAREQRMAGRSGAGCRDERARSGTVEWR